MQRELLRVQFALLNSLRQEAVQAIFVVAEAEQPADLSRLCSEVCGPVPLSDLLRCLEVKYVHAQLRRASRPQAQAIPRLVRLHHVARSGVDSQGVAVVEVGQGLGRIKERGGTLLTGLAKDITAEVVHVYKQFTALGGLAHTHRYRVHVSLHFRP